MSGGSSRNLYLLSRALAGSTTMQSVVTFVTLSEEHAMPTRGPWYSTRPVATKYHDNTRCIEGNNIEDRNLARGMGKLPLCIRCAQLNAAGK
jgi:hypothetical protein